MLAVADVDGDGFDDIVGGRPLNAYVVEDEPAGASASGAGRAPGRDRGGSTSRADVLIGAPGKDHARGTVTYLRGGAGGYSRDGAMTFAQGSGGISGPRRAFDAFGAAVSLLRFDGDRRADLVIGSPGERTVTVLGGRGARRPRVAAALTPARLGLEVPPEPPEASAGFGARLAP